MKKYMCPTMQVTEIDMQNVIAMSTHDEVGGYQLTKDRLDEMDEQNNSSGWTDGLW